jgi:hypothetical protein
MGQGKTLGRLGWLPSCCASVWMLYDDVKKSEALLSVEGDGKAVHFNIG